MTVMRLPGFCHVTTFVFPPVILSRNELRLNVSEF